MHRDTKQAILGMPECLKTDTRCPLSISGFKRSSLQSHSTIEKELMAYYEARWYEGDQKGNEVSSNVF